MSKADKKDPVVTTGKVKDLVVSPAVKKAFGGKADDKVTTITVENEHLAGTRLEYVKPAERIQDLPSVDQIEDAERILKAAGRTTEHRLGKVMFHGEELVPVETGLRAEFGRVKSEKLDKTIHLPGLHSFNLDDRVFGLYAVEQGDSKGYYLVDQDSYVEVQPEAADGRRNWMLYSNMIMNGTLVLINSISINDQVIGDSGLTNVESRENLLNGTTLTATRNPPNRHDLRHPHRDDPQGYLAPWDEGNTKPLPLLKTRALFTHSQFKRSMVMDSFLSKGVYRSVHITQSVIDGSGAPASVTGANLYRCALAGTRVHLKNTSMTECTVNSDAELIIKYTTFNNLHFSAKTVRITNKFNYLSLDTPTNKLYLVRSSLREFDLGASSYNMVRLKLDASAEEVRKVICAQLSFDEEGYPIALTSLTGSIADYLTEAVVSRLKVIRLLDEAKRLVRDVGMRETNYDDMHSA